MSESISDLCCAIYSFTCSVRFKYDLQPLEWLLQIVSGREFIKFGISFGISCFSNILVKYSWLILLGWYPFAFSIIIISLPQ